MLDDPERKPRYYDYYGFLTTSGKRWSMRIIFCTFPMAATFRNHAGLWEERLREKISGRSGGCLNILLKCFHTLSCSGRSWLVSWCRCARVPSKGHLLLKRYSMIGDGLTHVGFWRAGRGFRALNMAPLAVAVPVVILAAFILLRLKRQRKAEGRRRHCDDFHGRAGGGRYGEVRDHGNEFGFEQLYVRIDSCHEQKRREC